MIFLVKNVLHGICFGDLRSTNFNNSPQPNVSSGGGLLWASKVQSATHGAQSGFGFAQCWPTHLGANRTGHVFGSLLLDGEASLVSISGADLSLRT